MEGVAGGGTETRWMGLSRSGRERSGCGQLYRVLSVGAEGVAPVREEGKRPEGGMFYRAGWGRGRRFKRRSCLSRSDKGDAIRARLPVIGPHQNTLSSAILQHVPPPYSIILQIPPPNQSIPSPPPSTAAGGAPTATATANARRPVYLHPDTAMAIDPPRTRAIPSRVQESNPSPTLPGRSSKYKADPSRCALCC